jgi:chemotaxis protein histidine kinase CheA
MRLGLPAAGTIVRDWNGAVSVRSTLGLGSIFTLYLPLLAVRTLRLEARLLRHAARLFRLR